MISFDAATHTYTRNSDGKVLISVTTAIKKYILTNLYDGVPEAVLEKARKRGSDIHARVDAFEKGMPFADSEEFPDFLAYKAWAEKAKREGLDTELMVTDGEWLAGTIDQVHHLGNGEYAIADIKTTASVDVEYLKWQLSLYAYMMEKTNNRVKVTSLYCLHLRDGECKKVDIARLPDNAINALIEAIATDAETFDNPLKPKLQETEDLVNRYAYLTAAIADHNAIVKRYEKEMEDILARLDYTAEHNGADELPSSLGTFIRSKTVTKNLFNEKQFFAVHPELSKHREDGIKISVSNVKPKITWNK